MPGAASVFVRHRARCGAARHAVDPLSRTGFRRGWLPRDGADAACRPQQQPVSCRGPRNAGGPVDVAAYAGRGECKVNAITRVNAIARLSRRRVLQGMLGGGAVTVGLPFLDCFLDTNGVALAATGTAL